MNVHYSANLTITGYDIFALVREKEKLSQIWIDAKFRVLKSVPLISCLFNFYQVEQSIKSSNSTSNYSTPPNHFLLCWVML
jgi:hypothetical protein